jgi:MtN3 and saliva related transmembrane protein
MTLPTTEWLGFAAGTLTTIAFVPQVVKIWKSKHAHDISLAMFAIFSSGVALWLVYGILIGSLPVILANGITLTLALAILLLKLKYRD